MTVSLFDFKPVVLVIGVHSLELHEVLKINGQITHVHNLMFHVIIGTLVYLRMALNHHAFEVFEGLPSYTSILRLWKVLLLEGRYTIRLEGLADW